MHLLCRLLGALTTLSPEYCFVVEDEEGICGYALAALDSRDLHRRSTEAWLPAMREKYPKVDKEELTPAEVRAYPRNVTVVFVHW